MSQAGQCIVSSCLISSRLSDGYSTSLYYGAGFCLHILKQTVLTIMMMDLSALLLTDLSFYQMNYIFDLINHRGFKNVPNTFKFSLSIVSERKCQKDPRCYGRTLVHAQHKNVSSCPLCLGKSPSCRLCKLLSFLCTPPPSSAPSVALVYLFT